MIDIQIHRRILLNILKDIFVHKNLAAILGFKGGTCLYFFYELPRFSTDLDFNLVSNTHLFDPSWMQRLLGSYISLKDFQEKNSTWIWEGSYQKTFQRVKVEISKRDYPDQYELKELYGIPVKCLSIEHMFAHKLCAIKDRRIMANRDLFDAHYLFKKQFKFSEKIIRERTNLEPRKYFLDLIRYIPKHINKRGILDGLGEVLDSPNKQWAKTNLVKELLFQLRSYFS